ncbi:MAG: LysM peptidoglycan-binding domain-containing protein [Anaerolineae bacterium]|nr:LysM peptidoglycan-binding domain-containing protein [Anaerolineae bacterium]
MADLCGKGVWLAYSHDLQRAAEMATAISANSLLVKVGHGPHYFPETTKNLVKRVRIMGFRPLAWIQLTAQAPQDALKAIVESQSAGYDGAILVLGSAMVTGEQLRPLADALDNVEMPRRRLYLSTPPVAYLPDPRAIEILAPLCQGGWMPQCFAAWGKAPDVMVDRDIYQTLGELSLQWGKAPDVYPVLSPMRGLGNTMLLPEEFIPWIESIARHGMDFFSVYHADNTEKALWPMIESVNVACMETGGHAAVAEPVVESVVPVAQPIYITVATSDTVWGVIARYGLSKQQFWTWNAHLWDSRGLPRDPDYLQEGWRLRIK